MNKTIKTFALLFTAGLVLAGCGQKQDSTATTEATTTTVAPTTATPTTVYSLEDAKKAVFESTSSSGTDTMTLY